MVPFDETRDDTLLRLLAELARLRVNEDRLEAEVSQLRETVLELELAQAPQIDPFDLAPVACLTLDRHGAITKANRRALVLLGFTQNQLLGTPLLMRLNAASRRRFLEHVVATRRTVDPTTFEVAVASRERGSIPTRLSIRWTGGDHQGYAIALVDLSERNAAYERGARTERVRLQAEVARGRLSARGVRTNATEFSHPRNSQGRRLRSHRRHRPSH